MVEGRTVLQWNGKMAWAREGLLGADQSLCFSSNTNCPFFASPLVCVWGTWGGQVFFFPSLKEDCFGRRKTWVRVREGPQKYKSALQQGGTIVPSWTKAVQYPPCSQVPLECADRAPQGAFEKLTCCFFSLYPRFFDSTPQYLPCCLSCRTVSCQMVKGFPSLPF